MTMPAISKAIGHTASRPRQASPCARLERARNERGSNDREMPRARPRPGHPRSVTRRARARRYARDEAVTFAARPEPTTR